MRRKSRADSPEAVAPAEASMTLFGRGAIMVMDLEFSDLMSGPASGLADVLSPELGEAVWGSSERLRFLAEASEDLAASLDRGEILERLGMLLVPRLADWVAVCTPIDGGSGLQCEAAVIEPDRPTGRTGRSFTVDPDGEHPVSAAWRSQAPQFLPCLTVAQIDAELAADLPGAELYSMAVPLIARRRPIGVLWLLSGRQDRVYSVDDLDTVVGVARRAAIA